MAHIADCLIGSTEYGLNNFIAKELTPQSSVENLQQHGEEKEKYVWRMHQPTESRKYQLFPSKDKILLSSSGRSTPDSDQLPATGRRSKSKEPALIRRRKASVSDLGPMTTVQEIAMDSPTIPGRPPLHERSTSAPGHGWRHNVFGDTMISMIAGPTIEEKEAEENENLPETSWPLNSAEGKNTKARSVSPRIPKSPKLLKKLIIPIPSTTIAIPEHLISRSESRDEDEAPEVPPKPAGMTGRKSPRPQAGAVHTPKFSNSNTSSNTSLSSNEAPNTAPPGRTGKRPWDTPISACAPSSAPPEPPTGHFRNQSEQPTSSRVTEEGLGHRREQSETSIMDRGRPKKRSATGLARKHSKLEIEPRPQPLPPRELTEEEKAFAFLPTGFRAINADINLEAQEIDTLRRQAIGQAAKFEVLTIRDVEILSRELRALDERCEYLHKTHRSLRSGRRSLHERICSYLRSPRVARFSHSAILKQEEALVELDASIDDWVAKLEQAENRRTRVRQKLLEHVAAALTMNSPIPSSASSTTPPLNMSMNKNQRFVHNHNCGGHGISTPTPPRSPTKMNSSLASSPSSPPRSPTNHPSNNHSQSPQRLAEQVRIKSPEPDVRMSLQSIKIYADSDVYALLADVEEEINRMGDLETADSPSSPVESMSSGGMLNSATYEPVEKLVLH